MGETGSGKSTQLAGYLADHYILKDSRWIFNPKQIVVTQPRKIAAVNLQKRVNLEWFGGFKNAKKLTAENVRVGYDIGEQYFGRNTLIKYVTDEVLAREIAENESILDNYSTIIVDEAHERTIYTDILLGRLKEIINNSKPHLKLIVASATIEPRRFSEFLFDCEIFEIPGSQFPKEIKYLK